MIYDPDYRVMSPQIVSKFKNKNHNGEQGGSVEQIHGD